MQGFVLTLFLVIASFSAGEREERFFHTRHFWDGLERGLNAAGSMVQRRIDGNLETAMDRLSSLTQNIGSISEQIEHQVDDNVPTWMRAPSEGQEDAKISGVDDGLEIYLNNGDSIREELPEPESDQDQIPTEEQAPGIPAGSDRIPFLDIMTNFREGIHRHMFRNPMFQNGPFFWRNAAQPWWRGENVCVEEIEIDEAEKDHTSTPEGSSPAEAPAEEGLQDDALIVTSDVEAARGFMFSGQFEAKTCSEERNQYTCTTRIMRRGINRTIKKIHRCCHGYLREDTGCVAVNMIPLTEALEDMELTKFLALARTADVVDLLDTANLTLFVPSNEAVDDFNTDMAERNDLDIMDNEVYRRKRQASPNQIQEAVYSHIHEGILYAGDMTDEKVISSMATDSNIRINVFRQAGEPLITANCARVVRVNQHAQNGVVHTLDRMMPSATKSIADVISTDPQFSILKKLMSTSGLLKELKSDGQMTLLAPTDSAFRTLPENELQELLDSSACVPSVLKNHVLPNVICSAAITIPEAKTLNNLEKYLKVSLDDAGKIFFDDAQVVAKDMMATNGVIHIIDKPIMPTEAMLLLDVLKGMNLTKFVELVELADLIQEFKSMKDVTLFAPSNEAIERLGEEKMTYFKNNPEALKESIRFHIAASPFTAEHLQNNHQMKTVAGPNLRVNLYRGPVQMTLSNLFRPASSRMRVTAGCGVVNMRDSRAACGAAVQVVDDFLEPPKNSLLEKLESQEDISIFHDMVKNSNVSELLSGPGPFTILAPSDHVFKTLPEAELNSLLEDPELKEELIKRHILREHICCSGIAPMIFPLHNLERTLHGSTIHLHQTPGGLLKAGSARITRCSPPATNGIVHTVNSLYVEPHLPLRENHNNRWGSDPFIFRIPF